MPAKKSAKYPYQWKDGSWHSISEAQHVENKRANSTPIAPAPGTYDPNLDAQGRAAHRGLGDLIADVDTGKTNALDDYEIGTEANKTAAGRSLADLLTARSRTGEDYNTTIGNLQRQYSNLGTQQAGAQRKAGVSHGGAVMQAAEKRAANEAIDRAPIDTAYKRFTDDSTLAEGRLADDKKVADETLGLNYRRATDPLTTQQERAEREGVFFDTDLAAAKQFQSSQLGYGVLTQKPTDLGPAKAGEVKISTGKGYTPLSQWDFGYGPGVLHPPGYVAPKPKPKPKPKSKTFSSRG
jgi:hypothetical protein